MEAIAEHVACPRFYITAAPAGMAYHVGHTYSANVLAILCVSSIQNFNTPFPRKTRSGGAFHSSRDVDAVVSVRFSFTLDRSSGKRSAANLLALVPKERAVLPVFEIPAGAYVA